MQSILEKFFNLIYENACLVCSKPAKDLFICTSCEKEFVERKEKPTKNFDEITIYSWGLYDGKLRQGIIALKTDKKKLASYFAKKLIEFWNDLPKEIKNENYLVIPTPSHKKRIKERGYCQTELIAKEFANNLGLHFSNKLVIRSKETLYMNSLTSLNERVKNIKNAFEIISEEPIEKDILIIDDILTSGSTLRELARTIKEKYPKKNLIGLTVSAGDTYSIL